MARRFLVPLELPGDAGAALYAVPKQQLDVEINTRAPLVHAHSATDVTSGTFNWQRIPAVPNPPGTLSPTATPDASLNSNYRTVAATGDYTLNAPINPANGQLWRVRITAPAAGCTVTLAAALIRPLGMAATFDIPPNRRGDIGLLYDSTDNAGAGAWTVLAANPQAV